MIQRKKVCISMTDEIIKVLEAICKDTGLDKSKVVQELILKAGKDKKTREIITNENYMRQARKKMGSTSHNVQNVNEKNDSSEPYPEEPNNPGQGTFNIIAEDEEEIQRIIEIAKVRWVYEETD